MSQDTNEEKCYCSDIAMPHYHSDGRIVVRGNEEKKCECGKYPAKYDHVCSKDKHCPNCLVEFENTLLIFCPSCKNRLKYNVSTPPPETSTEEWKKQFDYRWKNRDYYDFGDIAIKSFISRIREEAQREVLKEMLDIQQKELEYAYKNGHLFNTSVKESILVYAQTKGITISDNEKK